MKFFLKSASCGVVIWLAFVFFTVPVSAQVNEDQLLELINQFRIENGLEPLQWDRKLNEAAEDKASVIITAQSFKHNVGGESFDTFVRDEGYNYEYVGENLAIDYYDANQVFQKWLASKKHRENILNANYTEAGIAVEKGVINGVETDVIVNYFAHPKPNTMLYVYGAIVMIAILVLLVFIPRRQSPLQPV